MDGNSKGCTAIVVLMVPYDKGPQNSNQASLYISNAGDSRAVLATQGRATALSIDHKPTHPGERLRITRAGSFVNAEGRVDGNLNLSRAIGDLMHKRNPNLGLKDQAITSFPDVKVVKINGKMDFIVMGCDGIWESHSN